MLLSPLRAARGGGLLFLFAAIGSAEIQPSLRVPPVKTPTGHLDPPLVNLDAYGFAPGLQRGNQRCACSAEWIAYCVFLIGPYVN